MEHAEVFVADKTRASGFLTIVYLQQTIAGGL